ncbi:MAG: hypothetical protein KDI46_02335 [Alphaproteobacteria bacterium]|nr:hypothetical protein [Alphaproteobacteria bacterium]
MRSGFLFALAVFALGFLGGPSLSFAKDFRAEFMQSCSRSKGEAYCSCAYLNYTSIVPFYDQKGLQNLEYNFENFTKKQLFKFRGVTPEAADAYCQKGEPLEELSYRQLIGEAPANYLELSAALTRDFHEYVRVHGLQTAGNWLPEYCQEKKLMVDAREDYERKTGNAAKALLPLNKFLKRRLAENGSSRRVVISGLAAGCGR